MAAPMLPVLLVLGAGWYAYKKFMGAVNDWSGDPNDPIFHPDWAKGPPPEWAKASGAADAYEQAVKADAGNPVTQNPVAGPYMPPTSWDWDPSTGTGGGQ